MYNSAETEYNSVNFHHAIVPAPTAVTWLLGMAKPKSNLTGPRSSLEAQDISDLGMTWSSLCMFVEILIVAITLMEAKEWKKNGKAGK